MKYISIAFIFILTLFGCRKDEKNPIYNLSQLTGKWQMVDRQVWENDVMVWQKLDEKDKPIIVQINPNGAMLNEQGFITCCAPLSITVNGIKYVIGYSNEKSDPICALVNCIRCDNLKIDLNGDEMTTTYCNGFQEKYIRKN